MGREEDGVDGRFTDVVQERLEGEVEAGDWLWSPLKGTAQMRRK